MSDQERKRAMKRSRVFQLCIALALLCVLAALSYLWHDSRKAHETAKPPDEAPQTPVVEPPPEQIKPVEDSGRHAEAETPSESSSQDTPPNERLDADLPLDPVERLNAMVDALYANNYKAEATPLIEKLEEVYHWEPTCGEAEMDTAIDLIERLVALGDPRAAPIIARYAGTGKLKGRGMDDAVVSFGAASVPLLVSYLKGKNLRPALPLARIVEAHPDELNEYAAQVIIPRLESITTAYTGPNIYAKEWAVEALERLNAVVERSRAHEAP